jgi:hypothetical protein
VTQITNPTDIEMAHEFLQFLYWDEIVKSPETVTPAKAGNHLKNWIPVFTGNPGFRLQFTPLQNGAGMASFSKSGNLWTDTI